MTHTPSTSQAESIVVSLEWAKKLKEAGWPQVCLHGRWFYPAKSDGTPHVNGVLSDMLETNHAKSVMLAAPTAEEILRRLPDNRNPESGCLLYCKRHKAGWWTVGYRVRGLWQKDYMHEAASLANAAAAMYCYLAKHNLLPAA